MTELPPNTHQVGVDTREWLVGGGACPELRPLRIVLCGLSDARHGFRFVRRDWEHSQVLVCHAGRGEVLIDGEFRPLVPGQAYVTPCGVPHAYHAVPDCDWGVSWATISEPPDHQPLVTATCPQVVETDALAFTDAIHHLHGEVVRGGNIGVRSGWATVVGLLAARMAGTEDGDHRLGQLWAEVDQDLSRPWTLDDLARMVGVGSERLRRLCLRRCGRSPMQQVAWLRMQRAAILLAARRGSVAEVATLVGYDNAFAFSTAFKRAHGVPPRRWKPI